MLDVRKCSGNELRKLEDGQLPPHTGCKFLPSHRGSLGPCLGKEGNTAGQKRRGRDGERSIQVLTKKPLGTACSAGPRATHGIIAPTFLDSLRLSSRKRFSLGVKVLILALTWKDITV